MNELTLMDCTLRDGANVVGTGYSAELTKMIIEGLIRSNIRVIEMGNAYGIGANETASRKRLSRTRNICSWSSPISRRRRSVCSWA